MYSDPIPEELFERHKNKKHIFQPGDVIGERVTIENKQITIGKYIVYSKSEGYSCIADELFTTYYCHVVYYEQGIARERFGVRLKNMTTGEFKSPIGITLQFTHWIESEDSISGFYPDSILYKMVGSGLSWGDVG